MNEILYLTLTLLEINIPSGLSPLEFIFLRFA